MALPDILVAGPPAFTEAIEHYFIYILWNEAMVLK